MSRPLSSPDHIPSHIGQERIHQNDVLTYRAKARKLWRKIARRLSSSFV